jgi:hypothetical protein
LVEGGKGGWVVKHSVFGLFMTLYFWQNIAAEAGFSSHHVSRARANGFFSTSKSIR